MGQLTSATAAVSPRSRSPFLNMTESRDLLQANMKQDGNQENLLTTLNGLLSRLGARVELDNRPDVYWCQPGRSQIRKLSASIDPKPKVSIQEYQTLKEDDGKNV